MVEKWFRTRTWPVFANRPDPTKTINCELISPSFPRAQISYRDIIPETEAEFPETVDVIYSAMVSVGALNQFVKKVKIIYLLLKQVYGQDKIGYPVETMDF